jgi:hypothetical protein
MLVVERAAGDRGRLAQARLPPLVSAHAFRGLRIRAALADEEEAPSARARRAERGKAKPGTWAVNKAMREAEREWLAKPRSPTSAWSPTGSEPRKRKGAGATAGCASKGPASGQAARKSKSLGLRFSSSSGPARTRDSRKSTEARAGRLDSHSSREAANLRRRWPGRGARIREPTVAVSA